MSDTRKRVLDMIEQGRITSAEGGALLRAMSGDRKLRFRTLFDPYERIGTVASLIVGLAAAVASAAAAVHFDIRYDGFMDLHMGTGSVSPATAAIDQLVALPVSALILWLVALPFSRNSRFVDFLSTLGVARVLQLAGGVVLALTTPDPSVLEKMARDPLTASGELVGMLPMIVAAVVLISWFIAALVFAFRHASGLRRGKLAVAFVAAILVAEIVSKLVLLVMP
jgi:hypothetical protein